MLVYAAGVAKHHRSIEEHLLASRSQQDEHAWSGFSDQKLPLLLHSGTGEIWIAHFVPASGCEAQALKVERED